MLRTKKVLSFLLTWGLLVVTSPTGPAAWAYVAMHPPVAAMQEAAESHLSASQIDELVSPIALYPDALVAQILAGSTFPDQVVTADAWVKANSKLNAAEMMKQVDGQSWDPSIKALTQFPSVLDNMAANLSWTSALGDAFYNQQADVMAAVQKLRKQAKAAGNLKSTDQQKVTTETQQGQQVIVIQPANPQVVYVPVYSPTVVYGTPYYPPGYSASTVAAASIISFGAGIAVGAAISGGWGWNSWGCGWRGGTVVYNRNVYVSNSNIYRNGGYYGNRPRPTPYGGSYNRNTNISGNNVNINTGNRNNINNSNRNNNINSGNRNNIKSGNNGNNNNRPNNGNNANRPSGGNNTNRPNSGNRPSTMPASDRGYGQKPATDTKTGAFSGYGSGGQTRTESTRGKQSYSGGGAKAQGGQRSAPAARSGGGGRKR